VEIFQEQKVPHLLIFPRLDDAISTALALKYLEPLPEDLIYFSPGKMVYSNRILGQERLAKGHALLVTSGDERSEKAIQSLLQKKGIKEQEEYLARMLWHERYFPMKLRRLGPGMLGAEVLTPTVKLTQMLDLAGRLCDGFALDPLLEVHFMQGNESLMLCYYLTDQGNQAAYALDAVKSMIVTAALVDQGAHPYSWGIWNNSFVDTMPKDELDMMVQAKHRNDPSNIMNAGKFFELKGRDMGIPAMLLAPDVAGNGLRAMAQFSKPLGPLFRAASLVAKKTMGPGKRDEAVMTADQCAMCGACVSVCPAYKVLHEERVTARGKLQTVKLLSIGAEISAEHAHRTFLCMRCKASEQVCQSKLDLIPTYDVLEKRLEGLYSKDVKEIERFVRFTESTPAYDELIQRGLVLGAPKNGMGGGDRV
jgi:ferredoxin